MENNVVRVEPDQDADEVPIPNDDLRVGSDDDNSRHEGQEEDDRLSEGHPGSFGSLDEQLAPDGDPSSDPSDSSSSSDDDHKNAIISKKVVAQP